MIRTELVTIAASGEWTGLLNTARGLALGACLTTWFIFSIGTRWYRSLSLTAVWCLFSGLSAVLLLANGLGRGYFAREDIELVTAGVWLFVTGLFVLFIVAFVVDAIRAHPKLMEERQRHANKPANRV